MANNQPSSIISKGIDEAIEAFKALKPVPAATEKEQLDQTFSKDALGYAQKMKAFYHFLAEDSVSLAALKGNVLEASNDTIANTKKTFEELGKEYQDKLLPALSQNIKLAGDLNKNFDTIQNLGSSLVADLSKEDALFKEIIGKSATEEELIDLAKKLGTEVSKVGVIRTAIAGQNEKLKTEFPNQFIELNFPAININFTAFGEAVAKLNENLAKNVKDLDKAEDAVLAEWLKIKPGPEAVDGNNLIAQLTEKKEAIKEVVVAATPETIAETPPKASSKSEPESAETVMNKLLSSQAFLKALVTRKEADNKITDDHSKLLDETEGLINEVQSSFKNLINSLNKALGKNNFESLSRTLLGIGKEIIGQLKSLAGIEELVVTLKSKLTIDPKKPSDVTEYLSRLSTTFAALVDPGKNFTQQLLQNALSLSSLHAKLNALHADNFKELEAAYKNSSLSKASVNIKGIKEELKKDKADPQFAKSLDELKKEMNALSEKLNKVKQDYLLEKNKADFQKTLAAA